MLPIATLSTIMSYFIVRNLQSNHQGKLKCEESSDLAPEVEVEGIIVDLA